MDIVYVTYNSEKWIDQCFESWLKVDCDLKNIHIYVVDNDSTDNTVKNLWRFKKGFGDKFAEFCIIEEHYNWGFGKGNNIGFSKGSSEYVCFLNIDTEMFQDTIQELEREISQSEEHVAVWEFRQFPYEHPKMYDILTGETSWSSGAAFAVRRSVFQEVGGFDEKIFMYAEDVDLSWRIRTAGYLLRYVPAVKIYHYSYETAGEIKPNQHVYSIVNNLLLRYRFSGKKGIIRGHLLFWRIICRREAFPGARKKLLATYWRHFRLIPHFWARKRYKRHRTTVGSFIALDYSENRDGAFYKNYLPASNPLVSVIVRTCGRPDVLRETLMSLRRQTYKNIEIVVLEDGPEISKKMINDEFSDLNILYQATGENVGRSRAGNMAMEMAHGKYLNFLDDDDLFFSDHVEVLVANLESSEKLAAYATAFETPIEILSKSPYKYLIKGYGRVHKQSFDRIQLCHHNYIPIQCIMFSKYLFEKYGGLDETVDALEDWDLWVRYSMYTDFEFIYKTTSVYRVPAVQEVNKKRQQDLDDALAVMREKHKGYTQKVSVYDIAKMYDKM